MQEETIRASIEDAINENPSEMAEKINTVLYAKVADALKTKKMEISNEWLNGIESSVDEEEDLDELAGHVAAYGVHKAVQGIRAKKAGTTIKGLQAKKREKQAAKAQDKAAAKPTSIRRARVAARKTAIASVERAKREKQRLKAQKKGKTGLVATGEEFDQEVDESLAQAAGAALGAAALKGGVSLIRAKAKKERGRMSGERKVAKAKFKADAKAQGRRKDIGKKK